MTVISFSAPWAIAILASLAVLQNVNAHKGFVKRFGSPPALHGRQDPPPGGGDPNGGSGEIQCGDAYTSMLGLTVVDQNENVNLDLLNGQFTPGDPNGDSVTADFTACSSTYMGYDDQAGQLSIDGSCVTVTFTDDGTGLGTVTLEDCATADDESQTAQFFGPAQDDVGLYLQFLGAPDSEPPHNIYFVINTGDDGNNYVYAALGDGSQKRDESSGGAEPGDGTMFQFVFLDDGSGQNKRFAPIGRRGQHRDGGFHRGNGHH